MNFSAGSRNGAVVALSFIRPAHETSSAGEGPGALAQATTAQPPPARARSAPTAVALQPCFGQTRSGSGRTSMERLPAAPLASSAKRRCTFAATCRVSPSGAPAPWGNTMRGQSTTIPPAAPADRLISGASLLDVVVEGESGCKYTPEGWTAPLGSSGGGVDEPQATNVIPTITASTRARVIGSLYSALR